jgi:hypothetical protein
MCALLAAVVTYESAGAIRAQPPHPRHHWRHDAGAIDVVVETICDDL